jgi:hypothetical protein
MALPQIIYSTLANKCPRCNQGPVFRSNNPYNFKKVFDMYEHCPVCNLKYEREYGFFYGSMYASYGLMAGILIIWFLVNLFWLDFGPGKLVMYVIGTMLLFFPLAFRWGRLLWLNFFVKYDKTFRRKKS